jgi:hypothetical protein
MTLKTEVIQPTASDFGSYVYCGAKLFLDKSPALESFRKAKHGSYDTSKKAISRFYGHQNEYKCIEWVLKMHKQPQNIIFDGTGKDNNQLFPAKINPFNVILQCRPDLIIKRSEQIILYEFKAVGNVNYLWYSEYDSVHAQVWCYRFIEYFKIDKYYLLRYYIDPFMQGAFPKETELTEEKLNDDKFVPLFEKYINVIETLNNANRASKKEYKLDLTKLNRPVNQPDKCHHCIYYSFYCTPECGPKR